MAQCIECDEKYFLDNGRGCTLRVCSQECLRKKVVDLIGSGIGGDINEVFHRQELLREQNEVLKKALNRIIERDGNEYLIALAALAECGGEVE